MDPQDELRISMNDPKVKNKLLGISPRIEKGYLVKESIDALEEYTAQKDFEGVNTKVFFDSYNTETKELNETRGSNMSRIKGEYSKLYGSFYKSKQEDFVKWVTNIIEDGFKGEYREKLVRGLKKLEEKKKGREWPI